MSPQENSTCNSHQIVEKHIIEVSAFVGEIREAVNNIRGDIDVLFMQNREIIKDINDLKREVSNVKLKILAIGAIGAAIFEISMAYIKNVVVR